MKQEIIEIIQTINTFPPKFKKDILEEYRTTKNIYHLIPTIDLSNEFESVNIMTKILSNEILVKYLLLYDIKFKECYDKYNKSIQNIDFLQFVKEWQGDKG